MRQITSDQLSELLAAQQPPCVSLYQPTHRQHPENQQDPIRFRNMLGKLESTLRETYGTREVRDLLKNFQPLARDDQFWNHRTDGLAVLSSPEVFHIFELLRPVRELLVVADSFHTKPLIRILQSADRFQILCLTRQEVRLYEGNRDSLAPVELTDVPSHLADVLGDERSPSTQPIGTYGTRTGGGGTTIHNEHAPQTNNVQADTDRFFRAVDQGILEHHSRPSGLPLMLAALAESIESFRRVSRNPFLMPGGILGDPGALSLEELRRSAWENIEPLYLARLEELKERFQTARARQDASADLSDIARAVVAGRVATLLVEADREIPGRFDRATGAIEFAPLSSPEVDDLIDDVMEATLRTGGEVIVVPAERMPTDTGLAATFRH
jgi:hypothetical protein